MSFWDTVKGLETADAIIEIASMMRESRKRPVYRYVYERSYNIHDTVSELSEKGCEIVQVIPDQKGIPGNGTILYRELKEGDNA